MQWPSSPRPGRGRTRILPTQRLTPSAGQWSRPQLRGNLRPETTAGDAHRGDLGRNHLVLPSALAPDRLHPAEPAVGAGLLLHPAWSPAFGCGHAVVRDGRCVAGRDRRVAEDLAAAPEHPRGRPRKWWVNPASSSAIVVPASPALARRAGRARSARGAARRWSGPGRR